MISLSEPTYWSKPITEVHLTSVFKFTTTFDITLGCDGSQSLLGLALPEQKAVG